MRPETMQNLLTKLCFAIAIFKKPTSNILLVTWDYGALF